MVERVVRGMSERDFGDLLREYRVAAELSQEALAERARISSAAVSALERNVRRGPQQQTLALIADALGLSAEKRSLLERAARDGRRRKPRPLSVVPVPAKPIASNVPNALTSFRGRASELDDLDRLVSLRRLITLLGPGGVGKTRLALESAHRQTRRSSFPDGVWFVDLAPATDAASILSAIARVLALPELGEAPAHERIRNAFGEKRLLLIFDNCEHVLHDAATVAETLLRDTRHLSIIATTREVLRAEGECVVRIEPLSFDASGGRSVAADLLIDRLVDANYNVYARLASEHEAPIATICRRLDGLPLALELAAGRAGELPLEKIATSLDERFAQLSEGRRTAVARHSTLRNTIHWSFELLSQDERAMFARLGIFADAFGADEAANVCGDGLERARDVLATLVAKSLVVSTPTPDGSARFRLLESTRAFALEQLHAAGSFDRYARRFAETFLRLAREADARFGRVSKSAFIASVAPDLANYRAALEWSLDRRNDVPLGADLAGSMGWIFRQIALFNEGRRWAQRALQHAGVLEPRVVARLHLATAYYSFAAGSMKDAMDEAAAAAALYRTAGARSELALALTQQAYCAFRLALPDIVLAASEEAVRIARSENNSYRLTAALNAYALTIPPAREAERLEVLEESLALARACGSHDAIVPTAHLAAAYYESGMLDKAFAYGHEMIEMARANNDLSTLASALTNFAAYALAAGDTDTAEDAAFEALELVRDLGKTMMAMCALQHLGSVAAKNREGVRAARLLGASNALYASFEFKREETEQRWYDESIALIRAQIGEDALEGHLRAGFALPVASAIAEGLMLEQRAHA